MKKVSSRGRKSSTTVNKIKELDVEVNPSYLSWNEKAGNIIIRATRKNGDKATTIVTLKSVQNDQAALFYAAAGVRNHFIRSGSLPDKKQRAQIICRSLHTQDTKGVWLNKKKPNETQVKQWENSQELKTDPSEVSITLPILDSEQKKKKIQGNRDMKYIYKKGSNSVVVDMPKSGTKAKFFSKREYSGVDNAIKAAKVYRDNLVKKVNTNEVVVTLKKVGELHGGSELSKSSEPQNKERSGFQGFIDNLMTVFR